MIILFLGPFDLHKKICLKLVLRKNWIFNHCGGGKGEGGLSRRSLLNANPTFHENPFCKNKKSLKFAQNIFNEKTPTLT